MKQYIRLSVCDPRRRIARQNLRRFRRTQAAISGRDRPPFADVLSATCGIPRSIPPLRAMADAHGLKPYSTTVMLTEKRMRNDRAAERPMRFEPKRSVANQNPMPSDLQIATATGGTSFFFFFFFCRWSRGIHEVQGSDQDADEFQSTPAL